MKIYVLACAMGRDGGGIYRFGLSEKGKLQLSDKYVCDKPMYAVRACDRLHVLLRSPFSVNENSGYFSINEDLTDASELKNTLGKCGCHLAVENSDSYIVNYLSGNVVKNCQKVISHKGVGVNLPRQDMPHTHYTCVSSDKKYVFVTDLGLDTVFMYDRDLHFVSASKVPNGYGVRHLAGSNNGRILYAMNELKPSISVFGYADGMLNYRYTVELPYTKENSTGAAIRLSEDEKFLYCSLRGENALYVFGVDNDKLQLIQKTDCGGDSPRDFDVFGSFLICTNENSNDVNVFRLEGGKIKEQTDKVLIPAPLCVLK